MQHDFQKMMEAAARLGRIAQGGDLNAATAAIQAALRGELPAAAPAPDPNVIDVAGRVVPAGDEAAPATAPAADQFLSGSFGQGPAARGYRLFVPARAALESLPLVVMLHGCKQDPEDFAAGTGMNTLASRQGFLVLYPAQSRKANPQGCWNWFKHTHQQRGHGEPAVIAGMTREVMARWRIDERRVFVAGLSAGGAMAAIMGQAYPDLFAAVGVHSGLAAGAATDLPGALMAMKQGIPARAAGSPSHVPTIVFQGDADATVNASNGPPVIAASTGSATPASTETVRTAGRRHATRHCYPGAGQGTEAEMWVVHGSPHAWSGGDAAGSYTDPLGPSATTEMLRFFMEHPRPGR